MATVTAKRVYPSPFFDKLGNAIMEVMSDFGLSSVTTASPVIAAFLKQHFPALHIRASVNMEIGTPEGVEYLLDDFTLVLFGREIECKSGRQLLSCKNFRTKGL